MKVSAEDPVYNVGSSDIPATSDAQRSDAFDGAQRQSIGSGYGIGGNSHGHVERREHSPAKRPIAQVFRPRKNAPINTKLKFGDSKQTLADIKKLINELKGKLKNPQNAGSTSFNLTSINQIVQLAMEHDAKIRGEKNSYSGRTPLNFLTSNLHNELVSIIKDIRKNDEEQYSEALKTAAEQIDDFKRRYGIPNKSIATASRE